MGDAEAKLPKYGGIKNVISAVPEIVSFQLKDDHDFIVLACNQSNCLRYIFYFFFNLNFLQNENPLRFFRFYIIWVRIGSIIKK